MPEVLTAIFTGIIALTGVVALIYAHMQLRESHAQAQVQHLMSFLQQYENEPMLTYLKNYGQKKLSGVDADSDEEKILNFFEMVGLLVNRGYLKDTDVWEAFAQDIFPLYADSREWIEQERKTDRATYSNFVSLAEGVEKIENDHHGTMAKPSKEEVRDFWQALIAMGRPSIRTMRHRRLRRMAAGRSTQEISNQDETR